MEKIIEDDKEFEQEKEEMLHLKKVGGGSLRMPNRIIKPNETFWARRDEIPDVFMSSLILLDDSPQSRVRRRRLKEESTYELKEKGGG